MLQVRDDPGLPSPGQLVEEGEVGGDKVARYGEVSLAEALEKILRRFVHLERQDQGFHPRGFMVAARRRPGEASHRVTSGRWCVSEPF